MSVPPTRLPLHAQWSPAGIARRTFWRRWSRIPIIPLLVLGVFVLAGVAGPFLLTSSPLRGDLGKSLIPPVGFGGNVVHALGTDVYGRDVFTRLIYGARISLLVSVTGGMLTMCVGSVVGIVGGYFGGLTDHILSGVTDVAQSLPTVLIGLAMAVILGASLLNVLLIVLLVFWANFARQVRGDVLSVKEREYVLAATALGASSLRTVARHVFPNVVDSIVVLFTLITGHVILFEGTLSFLGVGIPAPTPSWGGMIDEGRKNLETGWWVSSLSAGAMLLVLLSINSVGDWLRDCLDPHTRPLRTL